MLSCAFSDIQSVRSYLQARGKRRWKHACAQSPGCSLTRHTAFPSYKQGRGYQVAQQGHWCRRQGCSPQGPQTQLETRQGSAFPWWAGYMPALTPHNTWGLQPCSLHECCPQSSMSTGLSQLSGSCSGAWPHYCQGSHLIRPDSVPSCVILPIIMSPCKGQSWCTSRQNRPL